MTISTSRYIDKSGDLDARDVQFNLSVAGSHTGLTLTHMPTGQMVKGETASSRYLLQRRLMNELKEKVCNETARETHDD